MTILSQVRLMASVGINSHGYSVTDFLGLPSASRAAQRPFLIRLCGPEPVEGDGLAESSPDDTAEPNSPACSLPTRLFQTTHHESLGGLACLEASAISFAQT